MFGVSDAITADRFLRGHLVSTRESGWRTTLVSSPSSLLTNVAKESGVASEALDMPRAINPVRDLRSLVRAVVMMRRLRPAVTHVGTPKAGLVLGLAAWVTRIPQRIYTLHGLRLETASGLSRLILWVAEWLACRTATRVVAVSPSIAARAVSLRLLRQHKVVVFGAGSISGVEADRFKVTNESAQRWRTDLGLAADALVVLFVGRLSRDKGIADLLNAWPIVRSTVPSARLVIIGGKDASQPLPPETESLLSDGSISSLGYIEDPAIAFAASDLLVLPSYREGLPTVILEAAAAGTPAVATDVTGCSDAVLNGTTGRLIPARNPGALAAAVIDLLQDPQTRRTMGMAARDRVKREFSPRRLWTSYLQEYEAVVMKRRQC